jgi:hypothetical protein
MATMKKYTTLMFFLAAAIVGATSVNGATVFKDNFNSENGGSANFSTFNYYRFANWDVFSMVGHSDGSVDLIGNGYFDAYPGNGLFVDLSGSTTSDGILTTKKAFGAGVYDLTFNLGPNPSPYGNTITVALGDWSTTIDCKGSTSGMLGLYTYRIVSSLGGHLSFYDLAQVNTAGAVLDNVVLDSAPPASTPPASTPPASTTPVPVPFTLVLLGTGLFVLAGLRMRSGREADPE